MLPVSSSCSNLNLKFLNSLVAVKFRLYRVKAVEITSREEQSTKVKDWMDLVRDINACVSMIERMPSKDILSQIELALLKGA